MTYLQIKDLKNKTYITNLWKKGFYAMKTPKLHSQVLFACFVSYAIAYTGRLNLSVATPLLERNGILEKNQIGILRSTFFFTYAIGRIINGTIGDHVSPKIFQVTGLMFSGICNIIMSLFPPTWIMYIIWGLNGIFQSMIWGVALRNVSASYHNPDIAKRAVMVLSTSVGVGSLLGILLPTILARFGVRQIFSISGIIILSMSFLLIVLLPRQHNTCKTKIKFNFSCIFEPAVKKMIVPSMIHGAIKENLTLWLPLLFMDLYQLNLANASFYIFLMPLATLLGRLLFSYWYRCCHKDEYKTLISAFFVCALILIPFIFGIPSHWLMGASLAMISIITAIINTELISIYPINFQASNQVSTVSGILDCATYIGSALGSIGFAYLMLHINYNGMLTVWGMLCILSVFILLMSQKTKNIIRK